MGEKYKYFVYVVSGKLAKSQKTVDYKGYTSDLQRRLGEHLHGAQSKRKLRSYTAKMDPDSMQCSGAIALPAADIAREIELYLKKHAGAVSFLKHVTAMLVKYFRSYKTETPFALWFPNPDPEDPHCDGALFVPDLYGKGDVMDINKIKRPLPHIKAMGVKRTPYLGPNFKAKAIEMFEKGDIDDDHLRLLKMKTDREVIADWDIILVRIPDNPRTIPMEKTHNTLLFLESAYTGGSDYAVFVPDTDKQFIEDYQANAGSTGLVLGVLKVSVDKDDKTRLRTKLVIIESIWFQSDPGLEE